MSQEESIGGCVFLSAALFRRRWNLNQASFFNFAKSPSVRRTASCRARAINGSLFAILTCPVSPFHLLVNVIFEIETTIYISSPNSIRLTFLITIQSCLPLDVDKTACWLFEFGIRCFIDKTQTNPGTYGIKTKYNPSNEA